MGGGKIGKVLGEYKRGMLRSGSKTGPKVKSRAQAIAIGLSEARRAGEDIPPPKGGARSKVVRHLLRRKGAGDRSP